MKYCTMNKYVKFLVYSLTLLQLINEAVSNERLKMKQQYKYVYFVAYLILLALFISIGSISVMKYLEKNTLMIRLEKCLESYLNLINSELYFSRSTCS